MKILALAPARLPWDTPVMPKKKRPRPPRFAELVRLSNAEIRKVKAVKRALKKREAAKAARRPKRPPREDFNQAAFRAVQETIRLGEQSSRSE